jgi:hypothetical protein
MLEKYFKKGAVFEWTRPQTIPVPPDGILMDRRQHSSPMTFIGTAAELGYSAMMDATLPANYFAGVGLTPGTAISYKWLEWAPGRTVRVPLRTRNVLTGPMSGCPILRWQQGGQTYVGHVGTIFGNAPVNARVKASILPILPATATGFKPDFPVTTLASMMTPPSPLSGPEVLAFVTRAGQFYTTVFFSLRNPRPGMPDSLSAKFCGGSILMPPLQGARLQALLN